MSKLRNILLALAGVFLIAGLVLVGCNTRKNPDPNKNYTIYVQSVGGLKLSGVTVTASSSGSAFASGETDSSGKFVFNADDGVYDISVDNLPLGYTLIDTNTYKTSESNRTLKILAISSVIKETVPTEKVYREGDVIYDFSIIDKSGSSDETFTVSEILETKKMVLLNFWSTNCNPCMSEMPELEQAYREYKDDAEVLGINVPLMGAQTQRDINSTRTRVYTDSEGGSYSLSFPLAIDENNLPYHFAMTAIPVSVVVDRYGVIAKIHTGSMDKSTFASLFAKYTSENYVQDSTAGGDDTPGEDPLVREKPNVSQPESSLIEQAINGAGFTGSYYPETETADAEYSWPWIIGETNNEKYIHPANHEVNYSFATIYTQFSISETDVITENGKRVLVFDLQWSCENLGDYFYVIINNTLVYEYTGTEQWGKWQECYALVADEPGDYTLCLMYVKDQQLSEGADTVRIKNMRIISVPEISIPSLDMPRDAARDWDNTNYTRYVNVAIDSDGFYHKDSATGPYILADLMGVTPFNSRLNTAWSVSNFAVNGYFDYNDVDIDDPAYSPLLDDTDAITLWAMAANNSELYGLTLINRELRDLLNKFIKSQVGEDKFTDNMWLEFCKYFEHFGTDKDDTGINIPERNPIRGLLDSTAIPTVKAHEGAFTDLKNISDEYKNTVLIERLIVPRGIKYLFIPEKSGVYRFRTQSKELSDTTAWLTNYGITDNVYLVGTEQELENPDEDYNSVLTYYLEKGVKYIYRTCFSDLGNTGYYTFTAEYLGESYYSWQFASRNYFTTTDEGMAEIINYANVQPVPYENKYYNAKKDAAGNYVMQNGKYVPNLDDPIYVDFLTGARFFEQGSLELCFTYSDINAIVKTLSTIFSRIWSKRMPTGGWQADTTVESIKGSALNDDDWTQLFTKLYETYGDNVYVDDVKIINAIATSKTLGEIAEIIKKFYLNFFDQTYWRYDDSYGIDESRYRDYTALVKKYYDIAIKYKGNPERGYADKGCVQLTEELKDALDMFCKRIGGFPELSTDWLRLCAHFEYLGPYKA